LLAGSFFVTREIELEFINLLVGSTVKLAVIAVPVDESEDLKASDVA